MIGDTIALTGRSLKKWIRSPFSIFPIVIQATVWLLLFGNSFNPANSLSSSSSGGSLGLLSHAFDGAPNYITFLTPGVIGMLALTGMSFLGVDFVWDRLNGYLDMLKTSPIPRSSIYFGGVLQNIVKALVAAVITFLVALIVPDGLRLVSGFGIVNLLGVFFAIAMLTTVFSMLFTGISIAAKNTDSFFAVVNFLFFPVAFTSTAMFPIDFFPGWLKPVAQANPISLASEAARLLVVNPTLSASQFSSFSGDILGLCAYVAAFLVLGTLLARNALKAE
jgi:ABC-2 type transport system permease protein